MGIKIANSIDVTQSKAKKQIPPLNHSLKNRLENKKHLNLSNCFLEELGVSGQQFKTLFDSLPQGIALYKMIYNSKGSPIDFILLESNKVYDRFHHFQRNDRNGNNATDFKSKIKNDNVDWIAVLGRVDTSCIPEQFETYLESEDKWYQIFVYSPKKSFFVSIFMDITAKEAGCT